MNGSLQKLLRLIAATFLIAGVCNAAEFNGDGFRITLPDGFAAPVKSSTNKEGIETTTWLWKVPATGEALVISISKMPAKITDAVKLPRKRNTARDAGAVEERQRDARERGRAPR